MTRAIIENKKIVGFEKVIEPFNKPTAEEYRRRQKAVAEVTKARMIEKAE